ncbi:winged helix-turn-helix domain-containing protein [Shewanella sp. HL-SH5]|uniref:winged helix-turn-helix domain-containing protein n=1 Tax=Shewanella sp. HL-SH5 TaxID=3436241 RepID=UPI003EBED8F2
MDMLLANKNYKINSLTLDFSTQTLALHADKFVQLKPQSFQLLYYFCRSHHKIVNREELITHVWQSRIVSDNAINRAVSQLRAVIAQLDPNIEYIQTLPRTGYRLCVKVVEANNLIAFESAPDNTSENTVLSPLVSISNPTAISNPTSISNSISVANSTSVSIDSEQADNPSNTKKRFITSLMSLLLVIGSITVLSASSISTWLKGKTQQLTSEAYTYLPGAEYDTSTSRDWVVYINRDGPEYTVIANNKHNEKQVVLHKSADTIRFPKLSPNLDYMSVFLRKNERLNLRGCQLNVFSFHSLALLKQYPCGLGNVVNQRWINSSTIQIVTATEDQGISTMTVDVNLSQQPPSVSRAFSDVHLKFISIQFSPSGDEIALLSRNLINNQTQLNVFSNSSLIAQRSIILPGVNINAVLWLDNGNFMWLESGQLFTTDSTGMARTEVVTDIKDITLLNAVDGDNIYVSHGQTRTNLIKVASDGKEQPVAISSRDEFMPVFSHHSEQFIFFSNRTGSNEVWLSRNDSSISKIPLPEHELLIKPIQWSPDDSHIVMTTKRAIVIYSFDDANLTEIDMLNLQQIGWINNTELAILNGQNNNELTFYNLSNHTQNQVVLPASIAHFQIVDEKLYFSQHNSSDIGVYNLATHKIDYLGVEANSGQGMWQIENEFLYYMPISQDKLHIEKLNLKTGIKQPVYYFNITDAPIFSISSSLNILIQRQIRDESDVSKILMH